MFIRVLHPMRHNGERYKSDDIVEMDAKQAAILIADGIAEKTTKPAKRDKDKKPATGADAPSDEYDASSEDGNASGDEEGKDESAGAE